MKAPLFVAFISCLLAIPAQLSAAPSVVINELMYHPPRGWDTVQWIELHNHGTDPVNLGGWKLSGDTDHTFAAGTTLAPGAFLVVAADPKAFLEVYQAQPQAAFSGRLERDSGTVTLTTSAGESVDRVKYKDKERWPAAADGHSCSLERIHPASPPAAGNWKASPITAERAKPGGSPGARNTAYSDKPVPELRRASVSTANIRPGEKITLSTEASLEGGIRGVIARIQLIGFGGPPKDATVELRAGADGRYSGEYTAPKTPGVLRVRFEATGSNGTLRIAPDPAEIHPSIPVLVRHDDPRGKLDLVYVYSGTGGSPAQNRNQPSPEDRALWQLQQRILQEANPYPLVGALALTNSLEPGQLAKLRPVLKSAFDQRNRIVNDLYEAEDFSAAAKAMPGRMSAWRKDIQDQLNPVLSAAQKAQLADWAARSANSRARGFDPSQMLSSWINIEQMAFEGIAFTRLDEAIWAKARTELLNGIKLRASLMEPAKTAFESESSREKFQELVGKVQESIRESLGKAVPESEMQAVQDMQDAAQNFRLRERKPVTQGAARILGAFVHIPAGGGNAVLYDDVEVTPRNAGWKIHLAAGDRYHEMNSFNLIFESQERFVLAEPLALDLYRRAGNGAPTTEFVRLTVDDASQGYHLLVEQPNRRFLTRRGLNPDGVLYKIDWRGRTLEDLHERKSAGSGHADLRELVDRLNSTQGAEQWKIIRDQFDVPQVLTYFAVNSVLGHWDGYMNNYFIFHDTRGTGKWTMYPWDQDKTFGFHDGIRGDQVFTDMPVNFGATGDAPPGWNKPKPPLSFMEVFQRRPDWGWWRQPGPISGPLLANAECRKHYAARIRSLLDREFSAAVMNEAIDKLALQIRDEVEIRARAKGENPAEALKSLESNVGSLKRFVEGRRAYLLAQDEIKKAGPWTPDELRSAGKP